GCGWWRNFVIHPKCTLSEERCRRQQLFYDHGAGIMYWHKRYNGAALPISVHLVKEGHCTNETIRGRTHMHRRAYRSAPTIPYGFRDLTIELDANYSIDMVATKLGIAHLLR